jgi:hypothetical protein
MGRGGGGHGAETKALGSGRRTRTERAGIEHTALRVTNAPSMGRRRDRRAVGAGRGGSEGAVEQGAVRAPWLWPVRILAVLADRVLLDGVRAQHLDGVG